MPETLTLPDLDALDQAALKAMILHQHAHAKGQHEQLSSRASEIERLVLLLEKRQRMLFGAKSEKVLRQTRAAGAAAGRAAGGQCHRRDQGRCQGRAARAREAVPPSTG